jgi:hypothetical protein
VVEYCELTIRVPKESVPRIVGIPGYAGYDSKGIDADSQGALLGSAVAACTRGIESPDHRWIGKRRSAQPQATCGDAECD